MVTKKNLIILLFALSLAICFLVVFQRNPEGYMEYLIATRNGIRDQRIGHFDTLNEVKHIIIPTVPIFL